MTNNELHERLKDVEELLSSIRAELELKLKITETDYYSSRRNNEKAIAKIKALELILNL